MKTEDIIRLAREARLPACHATHPVALGRFAALVAAHEQEKLRTDVHSCGPHCERVICVAVREAVAAEREACAMVAEEATAAWTQHDYNSACMHIAAAIRGRK